MIAILHRKRLESTLPHVARGAIMAMISPGVGHEQPLHSPAHVTVGVRPNHQVEMVGHKTVSQDVDGKSRLGVGHGVDERIVVGRLMENHLPAIAPIEDMTPDVGDRGPCAPWHGSRLSRAAAACNISYVPFSTLRQERSNITTVVYDSAGRVATISQPDSTTEKFSNDQESGWTNSGTSLSPAAATLAGPGRQHLHQPQRQPDHDPALLGMAWEWPAT